MKKSIVFILLGFLFLCCSPKIRYFNENNVEISKAKFEEIRSTNALLDIPGDSTHHRKLTLREKRGKLTNKPKLEALLSKATEREIDPNKPIAIIYYPGKDRCNSTGSATKEKIRKKNERFIENMNILAGIKPIHIYKDKKGLDKYEGSVDWVKDPEGIVEKLFFEYHYPCYSFVVISKNGYYISYFGEFGSTYVLRVTETILNFDKSN
ncbi:hypothetical protein [Psychroflexus aestuariivivens]|uniref:hypothetical protein n=1 Tax=Psychroflexus aestuariivivens TaxID=1795040 RepID=UPI000FD771F2|nr:hypothetical protein [Psychroflexus aestuariivivens]